MITGSYLLLPDEIYPASSFKRAFVETYGADEWRCLVEVAGKDKPIVIHAGEESEVRDALLKFVGIKKPKTGPRRMHVVDPEL